MPDQPPPPPGNPMPRATTPQPAYVDGPAGRLAYRRSGSGDPVVLLHPLALSGACFTQLQDRLAAHHDVVAVDLRGHGDSEWDGEPFDVDDLVSDVVAVLDALELPHAHVVGLSMGGSVALTTAGLYAERVDRLVLADTTAWYGAHARATWAERAERAQSVPRVKQVPFQVDRWFTEEFRRTRPEQVREIVAIFLGTDSLVHAAASLALGRLDSRKLLPDVEAPTLVLAGDEDYATPPSMAEAIVDAVPHGSALILPAVRHLSLVERPDLADLLLAHLADRELPDVPAGPACCPEHEEATL